VLTVTEGVDQRLKFKAIRRGLVIAVESSAEKFRQDSASKCLSVGLIQRDNSYPIYQRDKLR
jgi:hypothetical protein